MCYNSRGVAMRIFNAFKKKPKAPLVAPPPASGLQGPPPPLPPQKIATEELPDFPKYQPKEDKTPELPSLTHEPPKRVEVPKPPRVEPVQHHKEIPDIAHFEAPKHEVMHVDTAPKQVVPEVYHEVVPKPEVPAQAIEGPLYIDIGDYKQILSNVFDIKKSLSGLNTSVASIKELKTKENTAFNSWYRVLNDIKKKCLYVDQTLFESKG